MSEPKNLKPIITTNAPPGKRKAEVTINERETKKPTIQEEEESLGDGSNQKTKVPRIKIITRKGKVTVKIKTKDLEGIPSHLCTTTKNITCKFKISEIPNLPGSFTKAGKRKGRPQKRKHLINNSPQPIPYDFASFRSKEE